MGSHNSTFGGRQGIALCDTSELEIDPKAGLSHAAVLCVCLRAMMASDERLCNKEPFSYCPFGLDCSKQKKLPGNHDRPKLCRTVCLHSEITTNILTAEAHGIALRLKNLIIKWSDSSDSSFQLVPFDGCVLNLNHRAGENPFLMTKGG